MKLTRLLLENFRCFGKATFDMVGKDGRPLDVVLLVGDNGSGKTAVLQAIAGLMTVFGPYRADALGAEDVRRGETSASIEMGLTDLVAENRVDLTFHAKIGIRAEPERGLREGFAHSVAPPNQQYKPWSQLVHDPHPRPTGLILFFDVYRILPPVSISGPNLQGVPRHRLEGALAPTVRRDGRVDLRFHQLKQWIVNLGFFRAMAIADRKEDLPLWATLRSALDRMLHPYAFDRVDERFEVLFQGPSGTARLEELSDGLRSVFAIVTELLLRLSLSTSDPAKILETEAVCLVDEIDAHLHPRWQERIIPFLRTLFPHVQWIATTHSPLVIRTVEPENAFRLEEAPSEKT
ncbi:MAG: AAA family ATPase [Planctomycetes bacterium]|nr:AAA family ATPase [Planctomycetota bacterium]